MTATSAITMKMRLVKIRKKNVNRNHYNIPFQSHHGYTILNELIKYINYRLINRSGFLSVTSKMVQMTVNLLCNNTGRFASTLAPLSNNKIRGRASSGFTLTVQFLVYV